METGAEELETELEPVGWQVRECAPPLSSVVVLRSARQPAGESEEVEWDCRVTPGRTVRFDLDSRDEGSHVLVGRLQLGDEDLSGWGATLYDGEAKGRFDDIALGATELDHEGRFEIRMSHGGKSLLAVVDPDRFVRVCEVVEFVEGSTV